MCCGQAICTELSPAGQRPRHSGPLGRDERGRPIGSNSFARTRATALDVMRAVEYHRYRAVVVENVIDFVTRWELFHWWVIGMCLLGYRFQLVCVSAAHIGDEDNPAAAQVRDRIYAVYLDSFEIWVPIFIRSSVSPMSARHWQPDGQMPRASYGAVSTSWPRSTSSTCTSNCAPGSSRNTSVKYGESSKRNDQPSRSSVVSGGSKSAVARQSSPSTVTVTRTSADPRHVDRFAHHSRRAGPSYRSMTTSLRLWGEEGKSGPRSIMHGGASPVLRGGTDCVRYSSLSSANCSHWRPDTAAVTNSVIVRSMPSWNHTTVR
jgi:site-specific DNA-cytosine methylase